MNITQYKSETVEVKRTVERLNKTELFFDEMYLPVDYYLRLNIVAFERGVSVNELANCIVRKFPRTLTELQNTAVLLRKGKLVATVEL